MIFRFVTGRLGTGKTMVSVGVAMSYLKKGRMVATNVDLYPENFGDKRNKTVRIYRLPDHPSSDDLKALPPGNATLVPGPDGSLIPGPNYDPAANSLLLLDELAQFLNTRSYTNKDRLNIISFLVLLRKRGWDAYFIVQHIDMVDKQIREALAQETGYCRDMSRLPIPILGSLTRKLTGKTLRFPKTFRVTFRDGYSPDGLKIESKTISGAVKRCYNTAQVLDAEYSPPWAIKHHGTAGVHMLLPAWHLEGYKLPPKVSFWSRFVSRALKVFGFVVVILASILSLITPSSWWRASYQ
ncbi:zonular occludens toxin domain-containing protein [Marinobacterium litorale]|uniref:zonular occludens toxin domain-containing protein n=1 Tax=Marinobacterium litorale TaxID=404770 RepID=UPI000426EB12|nr:zonular occludens toxin domain-containing protein [Marinobacterium litorale]